MALDAAAAAACATVIGAAVSGGNPVAAAAAVTAWTPIISALFEAIKTNAVVTPTLLVAPTGGGPVTGTGTVL